MPFDINSPGFSVHVSNFAIIFLSISILLLVAIVSFPIYGLYGAFDEIATGDLESGGRTSSMALAKSYRKGEWCERRTFDCKDGLETETYLKEWKAERPGFISTGQSVASRDLKW